MQKKFSTRMLAEGGIMIALAWVLSLVKLFSMPQGGSVTLGMMIPILLFAIRWGAIPGVIVGIIFGMLQGFFGGYVISPMQFVLDYPLAFGALGLAGLFRKSYLRTDDPSYLYMGVLLGVFGRFVCHVLSGVIFFSESAGLQNPWIYSMIYNSGYLGVELIIAIAIFIFFRLRRELFRVL